MTLAPGSRLGVYEVVAPIGAGGMGEVYRARDTRLVDGPTLAVRIAAGPVPLDEARRLRSNCSTSASPKRSTPGARQMWSGAPALRTQPGDRLATI